MSAQSQASVLKLYHSVIEDVIAGVRDSFLDEGVDEQVLQELKQIWESKLISSKAVDSNPEPPDPQPPQLVTQKTNTAVKTGIATVFQSNQHGGQQGIVPQQTQMVQQTAVQAQNLQTQNLHAQTQAQGVPQQGQPIQAATVITEPNRQVPIHITLPASQAGGDMPRVLTIQVPASALQGNQLHSVLTGPIISATMALPHHLACSLLQQHVTAALQGQAVSGSAQIQQHPQQQHQQQSQQQHQQQSQQQQQQITTNAGIPQNTTTNGNVMLGRQGFQQIGGNIRQLDGLHDTSDEDEDEDDDDDIDDDDENEDKDDDENEEENDGGPEEEPLNSEDDVSDEDPTDLFDTDNVVVCQYDKITRSRNKWKFHLKDGIMNLSGKDYIFQKANGDAEW